ncbi:hypothetical protein IE53DRAFT_389593 [Violaceomyces palustris]|uniref:Uncharacterized protein n=1 Tax=Violaceomyces palustris TaxID=1673888 RepID=A0ACD0NQY9_9BASI|nr:hypothetical protein IE53DRAFT_389593 [Violaceomyces palustris]
MPLGLLPFLIPTNLPSPPLFAYVSSLLFGYRYPPSVSALEPYDRPAWSPLSSLVSFEFSLGQFLSSSPSLVSTTSLAQPSL